MYASQGQPSPRWSQNASFSTGLSLSLPSRLHPSAPSPRSQGDLLVGELESPKGMAATHDTDSLMRRPLPFPTTPKGSRDSVRAQSQSATAQRLQNLALTIPQEGGRLPPPLQRLPTGGRQDTNRTPRGPTSTPYTGTTPVNPSGNSGSTGESLKDARNIETQLITLRAKMTRFFTVFVDEGVDSEVLGLGVLGLTDAKAVAKLAVREQARLRSLVNKGELLLSMKVHEVPRGTQIPLQGDAEMYTPANIIKRIGILYEPSLLAVTKKWWETIKPADRSFIGEAEWLQVLMCITRHLQPSLGPQQTLKLAIRDWVLETAGPFASLFPPALIAF